MANESNLGSDILYLSGHGSVGGTVCGEEGVDENSGYMRYFDLFRLWGMQKGYRKDCKDDGLRYPFWVVIAACFNMTPGIAQLWLRVMMKQRVPVRGILSYRTPAPLAVQAVPVSDKFGDALAAGKTMLKAWEEANDHNDKWAAIAFDYAKEDTLKSLSLLRKPPFTALPAKAKLYYCSNKDTWPVKIQAPPALFEMHHYEYSSWDKVLITNIDYLDGASSSDEVDTTGYEKNDSWTACQEPRSAERLGSDWDPVFYPGHIYSLHLFPPFRAGFEQGFKAGDQLHLSLIHVRHHYHDAFDFEKVFEVLLVNGQAARLGENYTILPTSSDPSIPDIPGREGGQREQQQRRSNNRISFDCPAADFIYDRDGQRSRRIKPARIVVRYRVAKNKPARLWFWFRVQVVRGGTPLFSQDLDSFIITPWSHDDGVHPAAPGNDGWHG